MRVEIEAAALFITKLVNKNLTNAVNSSSQQCGSSASSIHSSASSTSSSSESPPGFADDQTTQSSIGSEQSDGSTSSSSSSSTQNKVEQFRQSLTNALYERFYNHWFPDQPTKGQAYRCIRLNEWDRHDTTLQKACTQCGIDYKDLQLPVELTLWVDPDEVTCRFGENKGSHCLVAKFKDGELKDNNFNLDINSIDIEIFQQATNNNNNNNNHSTRQQSLLGSPDYHKHQQHNQQNHNNSGNNNNNYHFLHQHQQQQQQHHHHHNHHSNSNNSNSSSNNNHHHHQHHQQTQPPIHHRSNMNGKSAMFPSYHQNYLNGCDNNGNPIYYYF